MKVERFALSLLGAAGAVWAVAFADARSAITADSAPVVALALVVVTAGCGAGWWLGAESRGVGDAVQIAGALIGIGTLRELRLGEPASRLLSIGHLLGLVVLALVTMVVIARERRADARAPVLSLGVAFGVWVVATVAGEVVRRLPDHLIIDPAAPKVTRGYVPWASAVVLGLPLGATLWLIGALAYTRIVRPRLGRTRAGELVIDDHAVDALESNLATWIADPSVELGFLAEDGSWIDSHGRPFVVPTGQDRFVTTLTDGGRALAVLVQDPRLAARPGLPEFAATLAGSAVRADRDAALAEAHVADATRMGAQLLVADQVVRSELVGELRAGPCRGLAGLSDQVRTGADLASVSDAIRTVTTEVREISHGVHPPDLEAGGLAAALRSVRGVPAARFPRAIEMTAFLLARDRPGAQVVERGGALVVSGAPDPIPADLAGRLAVLGARVDGDTVALPLAEAD